MENSTALAKCPDRREEVLLGRVSPNEAEAFSMHIAKRSRFLPKSKRFTLKALLRYAQGASVAGSLRMTYSEMVGANPPPEKFCRVARGNSQF